MWSKVFAFFLVTLVSHGSGELHKNFNYFLPKPYGRVSRGVFLGAAVPLLLAGTAIGLEGYARLPQKFVFSSSPAPLSIPMPRGVLKDILIIFPGARGPDENALKLYNKIIAADKAKGVERLVFCYDWSKWVGNLVRAAYDSEAVGAALGKQVAALIDQSTNNQVINLHCIGISVGAFAAYNFLRTLTKTMTNKEVKLYRRLTLLDPFTSKGIFGPAYGPRQFGKEKYVDYFEHYLNTDDPVPTTSDPLPFGITYDVTNTASKQSFQALPGDSTHSWPVVYLIDHWKTEVGKNGKLARPEHGINRPPRGSIIQVK